MTHFSFLLIVLLLCVTSSNATNKVVDEDTICKKAKNHSFCSALLKSKPDSSKDLVSLILYTVDVARTNITNTSNLIKKLIAQSGNNKVAQRYYIVCLFHFGEHGALGQVGEIEQDLKRGVYEYLDHYASDIWLQIDECLTGESPSDPPYHETSMLPKYAEVVNQVADIIGILISYLLKRK